MIRCFLIQSCVFIAVPVILVVGFSFFFWLNYGCGEFYGILDLCLNSSLECLNLVFWVDLVVFVDGVFVDFT